LVKASESDGSQRELEALRRCVNRGQPFGSDDWVERMTKRFGLDTMFRPQGGPVKNRN
jgi:putative transposase